MLDARWQRPPFDVVRAAHAELQVTDLEAARHFYVDLLGLVVTEATTDALYLRGYEERVHHSLVLRQMRNQTRVEDPRTPAGAATGAVPAAAAAAAPEAAPEAVPAAVHLAYRVAREEDLDRLAAFFQERGCPLQWLDPGDEPGQGRAVRVQDPLGFPVEFFCAMEPAERLLQRFDRYRGAHVLRLDHFNLHVADVQAAYDHYKALGFRCSEYTATDPPGPEEKLWAAWMYRKPNVHDVALMNGDGPRLHHLGFWVSDTQSVLRACDIVAAAGRADAIERGPGRHGLSNAFFVYLRDPDGHRIELYTCDYYTGDPDFEPIRWSVNDPRRGTFWGHAAPASWFEESSRVLDLDGRLVPVEPAKLSERPQTVT
ncbi:3,4-dihydroxyphenylacetate 2,3-dioxygenase [Thermaerobacter marianensis DSM 12885]|uniref:3,4-dihydroxyphenylacetate 2,3-dioxygenase n=1 Tax=Thermaerobacter marianensis (strain ATCC 700841 / DSM 12885 / JCM 10246 / 7p75a) TaxID=644966 RepID=E6SIA7_THEM7|nr:3,4-dihydroxyphenylacetate 2,3-dioxygenase [Thermaerobacter marianensis]ADU51918.1 3,4-dihydroxyphenylacetate 2,3-dioxygenase [Thermaerobacter marianensis DSM 12885]